MGTESRLVLDSTIIDPFMGFYLNVVTPLLTHSHNTECFVIDEEETANGPNYKAQKHPQHRLDCLSLTA